MFRRQAAGSLNCELSKNCDGHLLQTLYAKAYALWQKALEKQKVAIQAANEPPYKTYHNSNYKQLEDGVTEAPQKEPNARNTIADLLDKIDPSYGQVFKNHVDKARKQDSIMDPALGVQKGTIAEAAAKMWSGNGVYRAVNKTLIDDKKDELKKWIVFIRVLNHYINRDAHVLTERVTTFRGTKLNADQLQQLEDLFIQAPGELVVRPPMYMATSTSEREAQRWAQNEMMVLELDIPAGTRNAFDIKQISLHPGEMEVLIPPYTPCRITRIDRNQKKIYVTVEDSKTYWDIEKATGKHSHADIPM